MPPTPTPNGRVRAEVDSNGVIFVKCAPQFERELRRFVTDIASRARGIVKERHERPPTHPLARRSTGNMRRSIQPYAGRAAVIKRTPNEISATISAGSNRAKYTRYVHQGTKRHRITPRKPGGKLSFVGAGQNGRKTFMKKTIEQLSNDEIADIYATGNEGEWQSAYKRRMRRHRDWKAGRQSWMREGDADVKVTETETPYGPRRVVVDEVMHPGTKASKFLVDAARAAVVARQGGVSRPGGASRKIGPRR